MAFDKLLLRRVLVLWLLEISCAEYQSVLIGVKGRDFVVIAADATFRRGLVAMDDNHDKILQIEDGRQVLAAIGDTGEIEQFCQSMKYSIALHRLRTERSPRAHEIAHFIRREIVSSRRDRRVIPDLKLLFAAVDKGTSLYWLDETGAALDLNFAVHGMGAALVLGHLDQVYRSDLSKEDALTLVQHCLNLLRERYAPSTHAGFFIKIIDHEGCDILRYKGNDRSADAVKRIASSSISDPTHPPPTQRAPPIGMRLVRYPPPGLKSTSSYAAAAAAASASSRSGGSCPPTKKTGP